jgi:hypothetical protein
MSCVNVSYRGRCPKKPVKGGDLCSVHKFWKAKKNEAKSKANVEMGESERTPKEQGVDDDTISIVSNDTNDTINITEAFVFECIDKYFKQSRERQELIESFGKREKSGGKLGLQGALGIGAMSIIPLILKHFNINPNINNATDIKTTTPPMEGAKRSEGEGRGYPAPPIKGRADDVVKEERSTPTSSSIQTTEGLSSDATSCNVRQ